MRRLGGLWPRLIAFDNLWLAWRRARRGKSRSRAAVRFELDLEQNLLGLQQRLADGSWAPGPYRLFSIYAPKPRVIAAAPFADRVVHHAVMLRLHACGPGPDRAHRPGPDRAGVSGVSDVPAPAAGERQAVSSPVAWHGGRVCGAAAGLAAAGRLGAGLDRPCPARRYAGSAPGDLRRCMLYLCVTPERSRGLRGGGWNDQPRNLRAANRNWNQPENRNNNLGLRLASPPAPPGAALS